MPVHALIAIHLCLQIVPQSVCSRYGLAIGSTVAPFVRVLVWICYPVAFPISKVRYVVLNTSVLKFSASLKSSNLVSSCVQCSNLDLFFFSFFLVILQLLDVLLGHGRVALFRRAELKTLVNLHGNEVCLTPL